MTFEEAFEIVESVLAQGRLNKVQKIVFEESWKGQPYDKIAKNFDYDAGYVRDTGSKLWKLLSEAFGERVTKNNFQSVLNQYSRCASQKLQQMPEVVPNQIATEGAIAHKRQDWGEAVDVSLFYGRTEELATLETVDRERSLSSGSLTGHGWDWQNCFVCKISRTDSG